MYRCAFCCNDLDIILHVSAKYVLNFAIRIENTHEAIIDQETWKIVRKVCEGKRRRNSMGEVNK